MNQNDRRVRKTRAALKHALITLMDTHPINTITIKMLVHEADVHRATFYTHYQDIYDLYTDIETEIINTLKQTITSNDVYNTSDLYQVLIDMIHANKQVFCALLSDQNEYSFLSKMAPIIEASYLQFWTQETHQPTATQAMVCLTKYHISGCISMITLWLKGQLPQTLQKEGLAELLNRINTHFETLELQ